MIKTIDRQALRSIRADLEAALPEIAKKIGVNIELVHRASYSYTDGKFTVVVTPLATDGTAVSKDEVEFKKNAASFGLEATDFGKSFMFIGKQYTVCGVAPRSWKRPIIASRNGTRFKFTTNSVLSGLGRKPIAVNATLHVHDESGDSFSGFAGPVED